MGVYIKGMEMLGNCFGCSTKVDPDNRRCNVDGHLFEETFSRLTNRRDEACPLVSVPPHGRLIDADALMHRLEYMLSYCTPGSHCTLRVHEMMVEVGTAPTIIPADPEEARAVEDAGPYEAPERAIAGYGPRIGKLAADSLLDKEE